jgi:ABC-2 type transport system ATP-binding protein
MKDVIRVRNLRKKFKDFVAVDGVSFDVKRGEVFAFLGPNGAGKSTTIKVMTTISSASEGEVLVNGFDIIRDKHNVRKSIGIIFQDTTLDEDLTAYENLNYHAVLYGVPKKDRRYRILEMLDYVGLLDRKDDLVRTFSGGMKRRVEIARGLLHDPKILFLDEPTIGLDVQTQNFLWRHVKKINKEKGITIFFTSHNMDEAQRVATKVAIIDKGKILTVGTPKKIMKETGAKNLEEAFLRLTGYDIRSERAEKGLMMKRRFGRK